MTSATELEDGVAALELNDIQQLEDTEAAENGHDADSAGAGGFRYDSPEDRIKVKAQRAAIWNWLKSVGANMMREGINLTKISMPVVLFEPRSFLERLTSNWEYFDLLSAAADCTDPAERMKYVVTFAVAGLCRQVGFYKPFNPILGETLQAHVENGVDLFIEQISHHPPVSSWQAIEQNGKFHFYGNGNWSASARGNSVKGRQAGINCVHFASDGARISYELPGLQVKGVMWGDRVIKYGGDMTFVDDKNGLTCEVQVDPPPTGSFLSSWFRASKKPHKPDMVKGTLRQGDTVLDTCSGTWLSSIEWEKGVRGRKSRKLWDIKSSPVRAAQPQAHEVLESDSRNRQDLIALRAGDQENAQQWKYKLEEVQRRDRKLRAEGGGYGG